MQTYLIWSFDVTWSKTIWIISLSLVVYFWLVDKLKIRSAALLRVLCEFVNGLSTRWIPPWWILVKALCLLLHFPQMLLLHSDGLPFIFSPIYSSKHFIAFNKYLACFRLLWSLTFICLYLEEAGFEPRSEGCTYFSTRGKETLGNS